MHNSLSFLTLLFMVPMLALAQTPQSQKELREDRMQALRVAFFVEELSLTPEESALFWPAWNEEEEKLKAHGDAVRAIETQLKSTESDEEAAELIQELKQLQRAGLELRHQAIDRIANEVPQIKNYIGSDTLTRALLDLHAFVRKLLIDIVFEMFVRSANHAYHRKM